MKSTSRFLRQSLVLVPALLLAACGGGGGGSSDGGTATAAQISITSANSQAVAAEAVEVSGNYESAAAGGALVTGVQVQGGGTGANAALLGSAVRKLVAMAPRSAAVATGVTTTSTVACTGGGSLTMTASTSGSSALVAGDGFEMSASDCVEGTGSDLMRMNGKSSVSVTAGVYDPASTVYPKSVTLRIVTTGFSVTSGSDTVVSNGDLTMALTERSDSDASITLTSASASYGIGSHTVTLKNYSTSVDESATDTVVQISADVETNNAHFGGGLVGYQITTVSAIHVSSSGAVAAGSIKVTGNASSLLLTVTSADTFSLKVDADGDGTYETTSTVSRSQLQGLI